MAIRTDRRGLLKSAALAAAGASPAAAQEAFETQAARRREADYIVVGAGYAGMTAAYRLKQAGASVIVLEANDRIGGRTWSIPTSNGGFIDVGAGWTGSGQTSVLSLAADLGLETYTSFDEGQALFVDRDGTVRPYSGFAYPIPEADAAELTGVVLSLNLMSEEIPPNAPWKAPQAEDWDSQSVGIWLRDNVTSDLARRIAGASLSIILAHHPNAASLLQLLFHIKTFGGIQNFSTGPGTADELRIVGGTQQIPLRIAKLLGRGAVQLGSPVRQINQNRRGVEVLTDKGAYHGRRAIVTVPMSLSGFIGYDPPLPTDRALLIQRVPRGTVWKIQMVYDRAFWREEGLSGASLAIDGSRLVQTIDAGGPPGVSSPGVLAAFAVDDAGRELDHLDPAARKESVLAEMVARFGPKAGKLSKKITPNYVEKDWAQEPWIRGDFGFYPGPRVLTALGFGPAIRKPFRRIHWAGTDTSTIWHGTIEGAATSAERAVQEVLTADAG
jgi:monoamine oxidase